MVLAILTKFGTMTQCAILDRSNRQTFKILIIQDGDFWPQGQCMPRSCRWRNVCRFCCW